MFRTALYLCTLITGVYLFTQNAESRVSIITDSGEVYASRIYPFQAHPQLSFVPQGIAKKLQLNPTDIIQVVVERPQGSAVLRPHVGTVLPEFSRRICQERTKLKLPLPPQADVAAQIRVFDSDGKMVVRNEYKVVTEINERTGTPTEHAFCTFNGKVPKIASIRTKDPKYTGSFWSVVENSTTHTRSITYHVIPTQDAFNFWIHRVPHTVISDLSTKVGGRQTKSDLPSALNLLFKRVAIKSRKKLPLYYQHIMALMGEVHPNLKNQYTLIPSSFENIKNLPYFSARQVLSKLPIRDAKKLLKTHQIVENKTKRPSTRVTLPNGVILSIKGRGAMVHKNLLNVKGLEGRVINIDDTQQTGRRKKK